MKTLHQIEREKVEKIVQEPNAHTRNYLYSDYLFVVHNNRPLRVGFYLLVFALGTILGKIL